MSGKGAPAACGQLDLALLLALQGDLARRSGYGRAVVRLAVAAPQMRQQQEFRIVADAILRAAHLDAGLFELREQLLDRYLQYLGKLYNRYISHI